MLPLSYFHAIVLDQNSTTTILIVIVNATTSLTFSSPTAPLTLYVFSVCRRTIDRVLGDSRSGSVCVNDTIVHLGGLAHSCNYYFYISANRIRVYNQTHRDHRSRISQSDLTAHTLIS